jgi:hypothetical protein
MLVLGAALAIFRGVYLNSVPNSTLPSDAAALFDTFVRFIKEALRALLVDRADRQAARQAGDDSSPVIRGRARGNARTLPAGQRITRKA